MLGTITKSYDPKKVIITFGGTPLMGFGDGTFIKVTSSSDAWTKKVGADGEVVRSRSNDDTSGVEVTLLQTSTSNTVLSTIVDLDLRFGTGALPLSITDLNGNAIFFWASAWCTKRPDVEYGKEASDVVWSFDTAQPAQQDIFGDYIF